MRRLIKADITVVAQDLMEEVTLADLLELEIQMNGAGLLVLPSGKRLSIRVNIKSKGVNA